MAENNPEQAGIQAAQERLAKIGQGLEAKTNREDILRAKFGGIPQDQGTTMAPSSEGTGKSPFELAANQGTLPAKDVSAEDQRLAQKRAEKARKGSSA